MPYLQTFFIIFKKHYKVILILGCTYGSMITFPVFGPVLIHTTEQKYILLISCCSLLFLTIGFLIKPFNRKRQSNILLLLCLINSFIISIFYFLPLSIKLLSVALLGFCAGRIIVYWARIMFEEVSSTDRSKVISLGLFFSYGFLYLINVFISSVPKPVAPLFSSLLILIAIIVLKKHSSVNKSKTSVTLKNSFPIPRSLFLLIFLVYIPAGITYTAVYPELSKYESLERLYNVLPFVLTVNIAGYISDARGRKYPLFIGISLLCLSFSFFLLKPGIIIYFLIQTTMQIAWSFLDLYVWVITADIVENLNRKEHYTFGLAFFSFGVLIGAILYAITKTININQSLYGIIAHLPLFISISFLSRIPETLKRQEKSEGFLFPSDEIMENICILLKDHCRFTPRELEVTLFILQGLSNVQISNKLYISENTVKYHLKNIFHKTGVTNRKELKNYVINLMKPKRT